jgi:KUP system potassium uptake protein
MATHPRRGTQAHHVAHAPRSPRELAAISLGALGVVYGDIGTSPLYAMKECLAWGPAGAAGFSAHAVEPTATNVMGVMSLMFWALTLIVVVKYLTFVLRADNKGEGGILSLAALVAGPDGTRGRIIIPVLLALFGAGLLFGEGIITPAISVLGAMEGLEVATTSLRPLVIPITLGILVGLFVVQRYGTHRIGAVFGWVMLLWFVSIGAAGVPWILAEPGVLAAINPAHAVEFMQHNQLHGFLLLGSVVLVITGGEALYADMGHFGRTPIRFAWYLVVFPGLLLNYFGQAGFFLRHAGTTGVIKNPFYEMLPDLAVYPMVLLAALAAIVASQALISGVFSLTRQAMLLGFSPRVQVVHTSADTEGQIYIPEINWMLMAGCLALVLMFKSSTNLAAAYGIAVTGTMAITSLLFFRVARTRFDWPMGKALVFLVVFITIDLTFFSANLHKITSGGWLPLVIGLVLFTVATTWWQGRQALAAAIGEQAVPDGAFIDDLDRVPLHRVSGTAVFMASQREGIPQVMLHHIKHNKMLHKQVILLSIETASVPWVPGNDALSVQELDKGFWRVHARVGFMQEPRVPRLLTRCHDVHGMPWEVADTTYYLGRQTLLTTGVAKMARWRKTLFSFLSRNSRPPTAFFDLPPNRVVELGMQIEL